MNPTARNGYHFLQDDGYTSMGHLKPGPGSVFTALDYRLRNGLHGCFQVMQAVSYAPGWCLEYCEYSGMIDDSAIDQFSAQERRTIWVLQPEQVRKVYGQLAAYGFRWLIPYIFSAAEPHLRALSHLTECIVDEAHRDGIPGPVRADHIIEFARLLNEVRTFAAAKHDRKLGYRFNTTDYLAWLVIASYPTGLRIQPLNVLIAHGWPQRELLLTSYLSTPEFMLNNWIRPSMVREAMTNCLLLIPPQRDEAAFTGIRRDIRWPGERGLWELRLRTLLEIEAQKGLS